MVLSLSLMRKIIALRNEKGSYNKRKTSYFLRLIIALRNEKGSYNFYHLLSVYRQIIALRNEKGSYNALLVALTENANYSTAK